VPCGTVCISWVLHNPGSVCTLLFVNLATCIKNLVMKRFFGSRVLDICEPYMKQLWLCKCIFYKFSLLIMWRDLLINCVFNDTVRLNTIEC
jgi:hypothetical protein